MTRYVEITRKEPCNPIMRRGYIELEYFVGIYVYNYLDRKWVTQTICIDPTWVWYFKVTKEFDSLEHIQTELFVDNI